MIMYHIRIQIKYMDLTYFIFSTEFLAREYRVFYHKFGSN